MFGMRDQQQRQQGETNQLVRVGTVTSVDPATATVRVEVADQDGLISHALPVIQRKTLKDKDFWLPDVGEHVACLFLPYGQEQGVCLGAIYSQADTPPERCDSVDKRHVTFPDGTWFEYDRAAHRLHVHVEGDIHIEATGNVTIIGQRIDLNPDG